MKRTASWMVRLGIALTFASFACIGCGGDDGVPPIPEGNPPASTEGAPSMNQGINVTGAPAQEQIAADASPGDTKAASPDACACKRPDKNAKKHHRDDDDQGEDKDDQGEDHR